MIADDINFFMNNFTAEEAEDYSGVCDLDALRSFQLSTAYCLTCSEDSSEGDYDPTREYFMADLADEQDDNAPGNACCHLGMCTTRGALLLECGAQLLCLPALLVELGLKLFELFQLCLARRRA